MGTTRVGSRQPRTPARGMVSACGGPDGKGADMRRAPVRWWCVACTPEACRARPAPPSPTCCPAQTSPLSRSHRQVGESEINQEISPGSVTCACPAGCSPSRRRMAGSLIRARATASATHIHKTGKVTLTTPSDTSQDNRCTSLTRDALLLAACPIPDTEVHISPTGQQAAMPTRPRSSWACACSLTDPTAACRPRRRRCRIRWRSRR